MHPMLNIGIRAAHAAGDNIVRYVDRIEGLEIDSKNRNDFVSEVDKQAEAIIIDHIRKAYPDHGILAEESGKHGNDTYQWIIDPLDGTTNFLHGFPQFAVSIGLLHKGVFDQAIVYDPLRQELFTASKGGGANLNNRRIRVSKQKALEGALIGTGFPYGDMDNLDNYLESFRKLCPVTAGIRRSGAAALDLAYVACGRLDGFWEYNLKKWDIAAGALLILESGGILSDIDKSDNYMSSGNIVAGNTRISTQLLDVLHS
jgi:myo-inositol-1(or 4)-monophosphatase